MSNLRPFLRDEYSSMTPLQIAVTDTLDEFVAEKVIKMKGDTHKSRKNFEFLIRWAGYGPADDTWECWDNCKDSVAVQTFLYSHKNKRISSLTKKDFNPNPTLTLESDGSDMEN